MAASFDYDAFEAVLQDSSRGKLVHSWVNHQYKFALDEAEAALEDDEVQDRVHLENVRTRMLDRDLQTLDEESEDDYLPEDDEDSPCYDSLFYKPPCSRQEKDASPVAEEEERQVALHFLLNEMRDWYLDDEEHRHGLVSFVLSSCAILV